MPDWLWEEASHGTSLEAAGQLFHPPGLSWAPSINQLPYIEVWLKLGCWPCQGDIYNCPLTLLGLLETVWTFVQSPVEMPRPTSQLWARTFRALAAEMNCLEDKEVFAGDCKWTPPRRMKAISQPCRGWVEVERRRGLCAGKRQSRMGPVYPCMSLLRVPNCKANRPLTLNHFCSYSQSCRQLNRSRWP